MIGEVGTARRLIALLLLASLAACLMLPASAASVGDFSDVAANAWYYDDVAYVVRQGLYAGVDGTHFAPQDTMTRGMFITVLGRYAGVDPAAWCAATVTGAGVNLRAGAGTTSSVLTTLPKGTGVTLLGTSGSWYYVQYGSTKGYISGDYIQPTYHRFTDVGYDAYYAGYAIWAYEKGIVSGMGSSSRFAPREDISREQICRLLGGYARCAGVTLPSAVAAVTFTDQSSISSWATSDVAAMQRADVVRGERYGAGYAFRPGSNATRAEAAAMFRRFASAAGSSGTGGADTPTPTSSPGSSGTGGASGGTSSAAATPVSGTVSVKATTLRVGILVNTRSVRQAVASVKLENTNGSGFQYGTYGSDRTFTAAGTLSASTLTITTNGSVFTVKDGSGTVVYTGGGNLALRPVASGKPLTRVNGGNRYFGDFELRQAYTASGYISVINCVPVEDYVKGVIPYEYSAGWPAEALKAAAVTARNFAMAQDWSIYSSYGFDVTGNTGAQTYLGRGTHPESYFSATDAAVDATRGQYLTYNGRLCVTNYFSSDGGATEDAAHVWGTSYAYLVGKVDPYEEAVASQASYYTKTISLGRTGSAMRTLASNAGLGSTTIAKNGIKIETYPATGNVKSITLTGENGRTVTITQSTSYDRWSFLKDFGFTAYSYRFSVTYDAGTDTFTCTRRGWGHNVGLSQWGAYSMARYYGKDYMDILGFYYTGTHLQNGA